MAVCELGREARQKGATRLVEHLGPTATRARDPDVTVLLEITWLGDEGCFREVARGLPASWRTAWTALSPLRAITEAKDEGAVLMQFLETPGTRPVPACEWAVFRLGDLKDTRAVQVLTQTLIRDTDWRLNQTVRDALICIGGTEVETNMLALLTHENRQRVRPAAIEVLFRLQGERSRDLARRMLREENWGLKRPALIQLGNLGTTDDLALLLPYCDYWKADRTTHYWAIGAVAQIRDRYNSDVNGPIVKRTPRR